MGKYDEAIEIATRYLSENPENDEYRLCLSQIYREMGNHEEAVNQFVSVFTEYSESVSPVTTIQGNSISVENLQHTDSKSVDSGPLVSVIMTAYKATELIDVAVNSILNQSYKNLELIIVDDASPDQTLEKISDLAAADPRIKVIGLEKNGGTYVAKNEGLLVAKGKYVAFHDSDDWCHQDKIKMQVERLEENPELVGISTSYIRVDENSNIIYRGKGAIRHACISLMIRRELVVNRIGYFDSVRVSADSEFEMRIGTVFGEDSIDHIRLPLIVASVRSESLSQGGRFAFQNQSQPKPVS